ncbi:MAG TPA: carbohydrate ABC transporter permease [Anaerolineae bacterium]|nr:carbohydrate ABC transporter permease [Anaerolineae bacterium]
MKPNARTMLSIGVAVIFVLPLIWLITASLRQPGLPAPRSIEWLPNPIVPGNYARIFELLPLGRYTLNSLIVVALAVPITIVTASWAAFAIAQLTGRGQRRLVVLSIGLLMIPLTALWLPRYVLFAWLGWINSYAALIAPAFMGTSPLFVLLFYWAFRRVPRELFESARLDGASALGVWWRVALPLAAPTMAAVGLLTFLTYWSDFVSPLLYLKSQSLYTLPVGLRQLQQLDRSNWPLLMAGAMLVTAPAVLAFLAVQHYFLGENSKPFGS